jgi:ABC-type multidrug transport system ATPase subunit
MQSLINQIGIILMDKLLLEVSNLKKTIKKKIIIDDFNLNLKSGEIVALLGLNGSGKSSIIKSLLGLMTPDQGKIAYFGRNFEHYKASSLLRVGCMFENLGFYEDMTLMENLLLITNIVGIHKPHYLEELLTTFRLLDYKKVKVKNLDFPTSKKLGMVRALLNYPSILILDEPLSGLDINTSKEICDILLRFVREKNMSILIASHLLREVEKIADRVMIIHNGKVMEALDKKTLLEYHDYYTIIRVNKVHGFSEILQRKGLSFSLEKDGIIVSKKDIAIHEILELAINNNIEIYEIYPQIFTLEDYFIRMIRNEVST